MYCTRLGFRLDLWHHIFPVFFHWNSVFQINDAALDFNVKDQIEYVAMASKADDSDLFRELRRQRKINLITSCRQNMDKSLHRKKMIHFMEKKEHKKIYHQRAYKVEPMQGIVKDIFDLNRCWMRGEQNNRWLFAAMGLTIQMHQLNAFKKGRSTWIIKEQVLG